LGIRGHIPTMAEDVCRIAFEPKPRAIGVEWHAVATYPSGYTEHVIFKSEAEAVRWLASDDCQVWLKARTPQHYVRDDPE
jgi:hypothetical protein